MHVFSHVTLYIFGGLCSPPGPLSVHGDLQAMFRGCCAFLHRDLPDPGINPKLLMSPESVCSLPLAPFGKPRKMGAKWQIYWSLGENGNLLQVSCLKPWQRASVGHICQSMSKGRSDTVELLCTHLTDIIEKKKGIPSNQWDLRTYTVSELGEGR